MTKIMVSIIKRFLYQRLQQCYYKNHGFDKKKISISKTALTTYPGFIIYDCSYISHVVFLKRLQFKKSWFQFWFDIWFEYNWFQANSIYSPIKPYPTEGWMQKMFYLLLYSIALRTLSLSHLDIDTTLILFWMEECNTRKFI